MTTASNAAPGTPRRDSASDLARPAHFRVLRQLALLVVLLLAPFHAATAQTGTDQSAADPVGCGGETITIAEFPWASAAILAQIHASLLRDGFGCAVDVVSGDAGSVAARMATTGQPLVAPEMWLGQVAAVWNTGVENDKVRIAGSSYLTGPFEGWYVPRYVLTQNPDLKSVADLEKQAGIFAPSPNVKPRFVTCPSGWACAVINNNLLKAYKLRARFDIVQPANRAELDDAFAQAVSTDSPVIGYYWGPNAAIARFDLVRLDMGPFDPDAMKCLATRQCADPQPSSFAPEQVSIAVATQLQSRSPEIDRYFQRASMPVDIMNGLLAWQADHRASISDTARHFVETEGALWQTWLGRPQN